MLLTSIIDMARTHKLYTRKKDKPLMFDKTLKKLKVFEKTLKFQLQKEISHVKCKI